MKLNQTRQRKVPLYCNPTFCQKNVSHPNAIYANMRIPFEVIARYNPKQTKNFYWIVIQSKPDKIVFVNTKPHPKLKIPFEVIPKPNQNLTKNIPLNQLQIQTRQNNFLRHATQPGGSMKCFVGFGLALNGIFNLKSGMMSRKIPLLLQIILQLDFFFFKVALSCS